MSVEVAPELRLNEEKDCYELGEQEFLRVSNVLKAAGFSEEMPDNPAIEAKILRGMTFGTLVHESTAHMDLNDGAWGYWPEDIPTEYLGFEETAEDYIERIGRRIEAWIKFKSEERVGIVECEKMVYSEELGVAGTLDRIAILGDGDTYILDIKCGSLKYGNNIQLALYSHLLNASTEHKRALVHLKDDGTYRMREPKTPLEDEMDALAAVRIARRKLRHTRKPK